MKKFIVLIMALITIFSASVTAFASSGSTGYYADWAIVDTILNLQQGSQNCTLVKYNTARPTPSMVDGTGAIKTQKTTYNVLHALYETVTVQGASWSQNIWSSGTFHWYQYGDYCWIRYNPDSDSGIGWVANYQGKILYCDAPVEETTYTISAIAGATGYCLTNRPAGTTGNGYLGDLLVTQDNLTTIHGIVDGLGGAADYYMVLRIVNGEYRYYIMCTYPNRQQYFVCNTSGQLFYALRDEVTDDGGDTGGGSTFDPTEVITAINSVYSAINSMNSNLGSRLANILNATNGIGVSVENLAANVVIGFTGVQEQLSTLNSYFTDLSGLFPVQETITLLGSNTRVAWDSADRITGVIASGFDNGDLTVKTNAGPLIDESGYESVKLSADTTEYTLSTVDDYRRITAANEYPDLGTPIPDGTLFYFPFDQSLNSSVGNFSFGFTSDSTVTTSYSLGINGDAFVFNGRQVLITPDYGNFVNFTNGSFTMSYWLYLTSYVPSSFVPYAFQFGSDNRLDFNIFKDGTMSYYFSCNGQSGSLTGSHTFPLNQWVNIAMTYTNSTFYGFINGELDASGTFSGFSGLKGTLRLAGGNFLANGTMLDEFIMINGRALWTSSFDAEKEAVFAEVAKDYFLPCTDQTIGLVFDDTINKTLSPTDVNGNAITMGRLEDDFSEIYMDISTMMWYCHDPQTQTEILLSSANQQIMNDTIYVRQNYTMLPADQITADALQNLLPVDSPVYLDMPEGAKLTITYDHYSGWFRMMYILMDKQTKLLSDLDIVNETIINVENTVIDITNSNPAYNVFYITKTDGTTESVGDAAKDAAVFVGDILSMFYRLVFDDALDNVGILNDFEGAYSNTEVSVW